MKECIRTGFVLLCSIGSSAIFGQGPWHPARQHFAAVLKAKDCSVYRAVAKDARLDIQASERLREQNLETLKRAREALDKCGEDRGLSQAPASQREQLLAELCAEAYQAWLSPGYRIQVVDEELQTERTSLQATLTYIDQHCPTIPTP